VRAIAAALSICGSVWRPHDAEYSPSVVVQLQQLVARKLSAVAWVCERLLDVYD